MSYFHVTIFDFHLLRDLYSHSHSRTFFILFSFIHSFILHSFIHSFIHQFTLHLFIICSSFVLRLFIIHPFLVCPSRSLQSYLQLVLAHRERVCAALRGMLTAPTAPTQRTAEQTETANQGLCGTQSQTAGINQGQNQAPSGVCVQSQQEHVQSTAAAVRPSSMRPRTSLIGGQRTFRREGAETMMQFDEALKMIDEI